MENIEKLEEKVSKDPSSKLFVPLAEEYRKAGRHDEAIEVLRRGLEHQPGYMSARAALGKIYLEKDMKAEAKEEFEKVAKAIPDNLFAQRKLADIYRDLGRTDEAAKRYEIVLELNPLDEEARFILDSLRPGEEAPGEAPAGEEEISEAAAVIEALSRAREPEETPQPEEEPLLEDLYGAAVDEDVFLNQSEEAEELAEEESAIVEEAGEEAGPAFAEEAKEAWQEEPGYSEAPEGASCDETLGETEAGPLEEMGREAEEAWQEEPGFPEPVEEASCDVPPEEEAPAEGIAMEPDRDMGELEAERADIFFGEPGEGPAEAAGEAGAGLEEADYLISRGEYLGAMRLYKAFLSQEPYNKEVLQRVEELRALLKLIGRDGEIYEANLGSFLEGIRKRRDEFFRST